MTAVVLCALMGTTAHVMYGWNPFKKEDWKKVGSAIKGAADTAADWAKSVGDQLVKALNKVPACAAVVPLGTEWAAQRAAYYVATATLDAAQKLQQLDPVLSDLRVQLAALEAQKVAIAALQKTASLGLDVTQALADATSAIVKEVSTAVGAAAAVKSFGGKASVADLKALKLPEFDLVVTIAGKDVTIKKLPIDFSSLAGFKKALVPAIKSIIATVSGGKVKKEDIDKVAPDSVVIGGVPPASSISSAQAQSAATGQSVVGSGQVQPTATGAPAGGTQSTATPTGVQTVTYNVQNYSGMVVQVTINGAQTPTSFTMQSSGLETVTVTGSCPMSITVQHSASSGKPAVDYTASAPLPCTTGTTATFYAIKTGLSISVG